MAVDLTSGSAQTLFVSEGRPSGGGVSPDGQRLVVILRAEPDTMLVLRPDGHVLHRIPLARDAAARWCGGSERLVVLLSDDEYHPHLAILEVTTGHMELLPTIGYVGHRFD